MAGQTREELIEMAKLAEQAERYDDMTERMKEVVEKYSADNALKVEERNLLSVAYKNVVGSRRSSWRVISSIIEKLEKGEAEEERHIQLATKKLSCIETELKTTCNEVIRLLEDHLISSAGEDSSSKVFYYKMKGDYHRYIAEVAKESEKESVVLAAEKAYSDAYELGKEKLSLTDPILLGLALNFSVFYYEIVNDQNKACQLAKKAFDDAMKVVNDDEVTQYKDSTLIMQLLRDNLTLWTDSDNQQEQQDED